VRETTRLLALSRCRYPQRRQAARVPGRRHLQLGRRGVQESV